VTLEFKDLSTTTKGLGEHRKLPQRVLWLQIEFRKICMPKKPTGGTHFTLPNKNFQNPMKHISGLSRTTFIFKYFQGLEFATLKFKCR